MTRYEPTAEELSRLAHNINHHAPHGDQAIRYEANRDDIHALGIELMCRCPRSRELSLALAKLEEVLFWANAAIAREKPKE